MQRRITRLALAVLALAGLLTTAGPSFAQFRANRSFGGWRGGSYVEPGYGWGNTYYGPSGWGGYYSGPTSTWAPGFYGQPGYVTNPVPYSQPFTYAAPGVTPGYTTVIPASGYQSFYPPSGTPLAGQAPADASRAYIHVHVPAGAQVFFDGTPTQQTGLDRTFMTPPLEAKQNYSYEISARWMENGQERKQNRTVQLIPGQTVNVDFTAVQGNVPKQSLSQPGGTAAPGVTPGAASKSTSPPRDAP